VPGEIDTQSRRAHDRCAVQEPEFVYRSRIATPSPYERALADELFQILGRVPHELPAIVEALRRSDVKPPDGGNWTVETLRAELARLGAGPSAGAPPPVRY
jgi:hypothetical protein